MLLLESNIGKQQTLIGKKEKNIGYLEKNIGKIGKNIGELEKSIGVLDPVTGEVPIDSKGRRSYSTGMSYCPSLKKFVVMGYLPKDIAL